MTAMNIVAGLIGLALAFAYLGTLTWAIYAWPFTLITVFVAALYFYDFVRSALYENNGA